MTAWLPWEGSNSHIPVCSSAFEIFEEFPLILPVCSLGDFQGHLQSDREPGDAHLSREKALRTLGGTLAVCFRVESGRSLAASPSPLRAQAV